MRKEYDFLVFIGRFQPFHLGHLAVVNAGLEQAQQMIILCGSAHQPRSTRNPWLASEREAMIRGAVNESDNQRLHIAPLMDIVYNDESWVRNVQATVNGFVTAHYGVVHKPAKVGLIGHSKDQSSYYLNLFPQWGAVQVDNFQDLSSTPIRQAIFGTEPGNSGKSYLNRKANNNLADHVIATLSQFVGTKTYKEIRDEHNFIESYKQAWKGAPYTPTFVTVDAVVIQSGHVLMVERKARPGKGLMALPGGFVHKNEKLLDACLRELREETRLKVPAPVLRGSIQGQQVFDEPHRSTRGRTITHAFYIELAANSHLPKVKGGDDARHAMWIPLAELDPTRLFEDHYFIIKSMTGL